MKITIRGIIASLISLVFLAWVYMPIYYMVSNAFKSNALTYRYPPVLFFVPSLQAFEEAFKVGSTATEYGLNWIILFIHSFELGLLGAGVALLLGVPLGFSLAHLNMPNKYGVAYSFLTLRILPPIVAILPAFILMEYLNLVDTYLGVTIEYALIGLPWVVWLMWTFFEGVPHTVFESAQLDGASNLVTMVRVMLPLVVPGLIVSAVFAFLAGYNDYIIELIIGGAQTTTLPVGLNTLVADKVALWNVAFAVGVANLVPSVVLLLLVRKHWARGLSLGLVQ